MSDMEHDGEWNYTLCRTGMKSSGFFRFETVDETAAAATTKGNRQLR